VGNNTGPTASPGSSPNSSSSGTPGSQAQQLLNYLLAP
jgi:hypothetical protein